MRMVRVLPGLSGTPQSVVWSVAVQSAFVVVVPSTHFTVAQFVEDRRATGASLNSHLDLALGGGTPKKAALTALVVGLS